MSLQSAVSTAPRTNSRLVIIDSELGLASTKTLKALKELLVSNASSGSFAPGAVLAFSNPISSPNALPRATRRRIRRTRRSN